MMAAAGHAEVPMTIREILSLKGAHVHTIDSDRTVLDAIALLVQHAIGALLVSDPSGAAAGIISERDVLRICRDRSADLGTIRVGDVMTRDLIICVPDDEVDYAMGIVTKNRVRHLPVMDGGRVAGMISIGDLVKAKLDTAEYQNRYLWEYIHGR
jgi:CBS domain-containing protein